MKIINMFLFIMLLFTNVCFAESFTCPGIQQIQDRTITQEFEWTVSEQTSLDAVLNSSALLAVTIENAGEFVTCTYSSQPTDVRLDAKPKADNCLMVTESAAWEESSNRQVCTEANKLRCQFSVSCQLILDSEDS